MSYQSMEEAQLRCKKDGIPFWKAVQIEDANERGELLETDDRYVAVYAGKPGCL